jgi:hypothetical protein
MEFYTVCGDGFNSLSRRVIMATGKKAGSNAGRTLKQKGEGRKEKSAAGSALAQRPKHGKKK